MARPSQVLFRPLKGIPDLGEYMVVWLSSSSWRLYPHLLSLFSFSPSHLLLPRSPASSCYGQHIYSTSSVPSTTRSPGNTKLTEQKMWSHSRSLGASRISYKGLALQVGELRPRERKGLARSHTSARTRLGCKATLWPRSRILPLCRGDDGE